MKHISINTPTTDNLTIEDIIKSNFDMLEYEIKNERIKELGIAINILKPVEKRL